MTARDGRLVEEMMEMFHINAADWYVVAGGGIEAAAWTQTLLEGCDSHTHTDTEITQSSIDRLHYSQPWWIRFNSSTSS